VTSVQTNDVNGDNYEDVLLAYKEIEKEGKLYTRITHQCAFENISAISYLWKISTKKIQFEFQQNWAYKIVCRWVAWSKNSIFNRRI
jgi:hypothetical protein